MFKDRRRPPVPYDPSKRKQYTHSKTTSALDDETKVDISKDGIVTITQGNVENDDYDQVQLKAWMIFRIKSLLNETQKVTWVDREKRDEQ